MTPEFDVVTGAFGYTGKYIARRLISLGRKVKTLTRHPDRPNPSGDQIAIAPLNFNSPAELVRNLLRARTVFNTYWVRFQHGGVTFDQAIEDTKVLIEAAKIAGVRRFVHISVSNASEDSPLPYFRGKGMLEKIISQSGISYAIIRPTVVFGPEDILINNIAWLLRRFPVFAIARSGEYRLQPIFVEDVAAIAVDAAARSGNLIMDAAGPETFTYSEMVRLIARTVRTNARIIHIDPMLVLLASKLVGYLVNDVVLTRTELEGLMANLLVTAGLPAGQTRLSDWLAQHAGNLGTRYASELARHYR